jgi:hypothetical protein
MCSAETTRFQKKIPEDFTKLAKVLNKKELSEVLSKSKNWTTLVWTLMYFF